MEEYRTEDGQVVKYIHDDGSETAIKTVSSCGNILNKATGKIEPVEVDRNKFSCFISSSVGCPIGCKFCYLTVKKFPYHKLTKKDIVKNVQSALVEELAYSDYSHKYNNKFIKLSWMGMGDALLLDPPIVYEATHDILGHIYDLNLVSGVDGVDISTVLPHNKKGWPYWLGMLNKDLHYGFIRNPKSLDRSPVRLFYSLHHGELIPIERNVNRDFETLQWFNYMYGVDIIIHHMFIEGWTDTEEHLDYIEIFLRRFDFNPEIRILRYNECPNSPYKEAPNFDELVKHAADIFPKVKYQVSAGSEIKAACGQFLCKKMEER